MCGDSEQECRGRAERHRLEQDEARLRVALETAADALRSAAKYLRYVSAFAFAEQVEIDEAQARRALLGPKEGGK
jgi:hypothetical protein